MRRSDAVSVVTGALPAAFAAPVLSGAAISVARLVALPQPLPGFIGGGTNADALALYHGFGVYHDPATGYLGSVYTPGLALLVSFLDRAVMWSGWVPLICYLASFVIAGFAGWLACRGPRSGGFCILAIVEGLGFAALSWLLLSTLRNPSLYTGHIDHPAWALALGGLLMMPRAARGLRPALVGAIVLFTLGLWTKQTAVAAPLASFVWLSVRGPSGRRIAVVLALALLSINGAIAGILILVTHGWAGRLLFLFGLHQPVYYHAGFIANEFLSDHALLLLSGGAMWALVLLPRVRGSREHRSQPLAADTRPYVSLICLFVLVAGVSAFAARRVQGGQDSDYIPVTWGLILLMAVGYRSLRRQTWGQIAAAVPVACLLLVAATPSLKARLAGHDIQVPPSLRPAVTWPSSSPGVGPPGVGPPSPAYYDWTGTVLSRDKSGRPYPPVTGLLAALALGRPPGYFINALLDRRFSALQLFPQSFERGGVDEFASADGRYEQGFFWKLNRVIASRYVSAPGRPPGLLVRRRGPEPDRWMRACFAPLILGSAKFFIGHGGGFWCHLGGAGARLALVDTPSPYSEVHTGMAITHLRGELDVSLTSGTLDIALGAAAAPAWELRLTRTSATRAMRFDAFRQGRLVMRASIANSAAQRAGRLRMIFGSSSVRGETVDVNGELMQVMLGSMTQGHRLSFSASRASHATFALSRLALT